MTGRRGRADREVAEATGGLAVAGDAADPAHAEAVVDRRVDAFGGSTWWSRTPASGSTAQRGDVDDEGWRATIDVNLTGPLCLVRAACRTDDRARRRLDRAGLERDRGFAASTDRRRLRRVEGGPDRPDARRSPSTSGRAGVRANAVCPGWVRTPMGDACDGRARRRAAIPRRGLPARDAARAAAARRRARGDRAVLPRSSRATRPRIVTGDDAAWPTAGRPRSTSAAIAFAIAGGGVVSFDHARTGGVRDRRRVGHRHGRSRCASPARGPRSSVADVRLDAAAETVDADRGRRGARARDRARRARSRPQADAGPRRRARGVRRRCTTS